MEDQENEGTSQETQGTGQSWIRRALEYLGELVRVIVISLAIILPVRYFLLQPFYVKGASMEPNFYDQEYLIIDEITYRLRNPERGEIVVFRYPADPSQFFIKRVIGLPGETVIVGNGSVTIKNKEHSLGVRLKEFYLLSSIQTPGSKEATLGPQEYFLLGDNRPSSLDSRYFGPVLRNYIVGRVWLRGWPLNRISHFLTPVYEIDKSAVQS